jgi:hypothetical protein
MQPTERRCSRCNMVKAETRFRLQTTGYRHSFCLECERGYNRERVRLYSARKREERRIRANPPHRCSAPLCCTTSLALGSAPDLSLGVLFGLGRRNIDLKREGLPRIGFVTEGAKGFSVWLDRRAPARTFGRMARVRSWASENKVRLVRLPSLC